MKAGLLLKQRATGRELFRITPRSELPRPTLLLSTPVCEMLIIYSSQKVSLCTYVIIIPQKSDIFLRKKTMKLREYLPCKGYMLGFLTQRRMSSHCKLTGSRVRQKHSKYTNYFWLWLLLSIGSFLFWCDCCISWPLALVTTILELNINAMLLTSFIAKLDTIQSNCCQSFIAHSDHNQHTFRRNWAVLEIQTKARLHSDHNQYTFRVIWAVFEIQTKTRLYSDYNQYTFRVIWAVHFLKFKWKWNYIQTITSRHSEGYTFRLEIRWNWDSTQIISSNHSEYWHFWYSYPIQSYLRCAESQFTENHILKLL